MSTGVDRARELRRNMTNAERLFWSRVRADALGVPFRRQMLIGPFIVDFACSSRKLVVEIDGGQHAGSIRDAARDAYLAERGYRVLRFWNNDVLSNIDGVLETLQAALSEHPKLTR